MAERDSLNQLRTLPDGTRPQLYNLTADPGESHNLAGAQPALIERLRGELLAWRKSVPVTFPLQPDDPNSRPASQR